MKDCYWFLGGLVSLQKYSKCSVQKSSEAVEYTFFDKNPFYKQPSTRQPKVKETFRTTRFLIRNHFINTLVLDSLKFKI